MESSVPLVDYVAQLGSLAKEIRCRVDGIGADLIPTLFASHEGRLIGVATADESTDESAEAQFRRASEAAALMRTGWSADAICLLTEAFVAVGDAQDEPDLAAAFATGNPDVHECLFVLGATAEEAVVCALPYRYGVGRTILWGEPLGETSVPAQAGPYLTMFARVFSLPQVPFPPDEAGAISAIAEVIGEVGFVVEAFADEVWL